MYLFAGKEKYKTSANKGEGLYFDTRHQKHTDQDQIQNIKFNLCGFCPSGYFLSILDSAKYSYARRKKAIDDHNRKR